MDFKKKIAVVTGAASGIGFALAERFGQEGMKVVLADINPNALVKAGEQLANQGMDVLTCVTDVSLKEDIEQLAQKTLEQFGGVHILCNNAGVCKGGVSWEIPLEDYQWMFGVNLWGVIYGVRTFLPIMEEQDEEAWIINTSSQSGLTTTPFSTEYCTSKAAVLTYSECVYKELLTLGSKVRVAVLCPAAVQTNIAKSENYKPECFLIEREATPMEQLVTSALEEEVKSGISPAEQANQVISALEEGKFYILPEDKWREAINHRMQEIIMGENPSINF